jgi:hypothetical protein
VRIGGTGSLARVVTNFVLVKDRIMDIELKTGFNDDGPA